MGARICARDAAPMQPSHLLIPPVALMGFALALAALSWLS
jgi:hypothetical protein